MSEVSYRCEACDAPCVLELTAGPRPRTRVRCTQCSACYDVRLTPVRTTEHVWRIVHPNGDEATFASRDELRRAVLGNRFDARASGAFATASEAPAADDASEDTQASAKSPSVGSIPIVVAAEPAPEPAPAPAPSLEVAPMSSDVEEVPDSQIESVPPSADAHASEPALQLSLRDLEAAKAHASGADDDDDDDEADREPLSLSGAEVVEAATAMVLQNAREAHARDAAGPPVRSPSVPPPFRPASVPPPAPPAAARVSAPPPPLPLTRSAAPHKSPELGSVGDAASASLAAAAAAVMAAVANADPERAADVVTLPEQKFPSHVNGASGVSTANAATAALDALETPIPRDAAAASSRPPAAIPIPASAKHSEPELPEGEDAEDAEAREAARPSDAGKPEEAIERKPLSLSTPRPASARATDLLAAATAPKRDRDAAKDAPKEDVAEAKDADKSAEKDAEKAADQAKAKASTSSHPPPARAVSVSPSASSPSASASASASTASSVSSPSKAGSKAAAKSPSKSTTSSVRSTAPSRTPPPAAALTVADDKEKRGGGWTMPALLLAGTCVVLFLLARRPSGGSATADTTPPPAAATAAAVDTSGNATTTTTAPGADTVTNANAAPSATGVAAPAAPASASAAGALAADPPAPATPASSASPSSPSSKPAQDDKGHAAADKDHANEPPASLVHRASIAERQGDLPHAKELYTAALAKNPRDAEALSGLGDNARAQGDRAGAVAAYQKALDVSPSFFPALLGLADTLWEQGDHAGAQKRYAEIAERFQDVPERVRTRATAAP